MRVWFYISFFKSTVFVRLFLKAPCSHGEGGLGDGDHWAGPVMSHGLGVEYVLASWHDYSRLGPGPEPPHQQTQHNQQQHQHQHVRKRLKTLPPLHVTAASCTNAMRFACGFYFSAQLDSTQSSKNEEKLHFVKLNPGCPAFVHAGQ